MVWCFIFSYNDLSTHEITAERIPTMAAERSPLQQKKRVNRRTQTDDQQLQTSNHTHMPVVEGAKLKQPDNILALQRTLGNQAAIKLLQPHAPVIQRDWIKGKVSEETTRGTVSIGTTVGPATNAPKFRSKNPDKLTKNDKLFGAYQGYKIGKKVKGSTQSIIENADKTTATVQPPEEYAGQFSTAANVLSDAAAGGSVIALQAALSGFTGLIMPYIKLVKMAIKIPMSIRKTHKTRMNMQALKKAYKGSEAKAKDGDPVAQSVYDSAKYGYKKVRRQFAERIAKVIMAIAKFAMTITDLVTGGTAILFTSIGKLLTGVSKGIMAGFAAAKSLYKSVKGTKGVNRRINAENLITAANAGNTEALTLFYKMKIGRSLYFKQNGLKTSKNPLKKDPSFFKGDQRGYSTWLMSLSSREWGRLRSEVEKKLRSSTFKTFEQKARSARSKLGV